MITTDSFKPYQYVRESNCLTNFLDHSCFATQNLDGDRNQFLAKITKPPPAAKHQTSTMSRKEPVCSKNHHTSPAEITKPQPCAEKNQFEAKITKPLAAKITKPNHVLASTGTGLHESVNQCKSLRC